MMKNENINEITVSDEQMPETDVMDLFAEELPEQNDLVVPSTTFSSLTSISSGSCPWSTAGTLTSASSIG
ncbi:MAG TPA: thiocillin family RiPP [Ktedonobacteraceae bacterium]|nr:thiocillin family RiPP [Ktedonobacteraceae bacterium]